MLRDKNLIPLSRQHQHALALCVWIERASPIPERDLARWQMEIAQHFRAEIRVHFKAEEQFVFPSACQFKELNLLVEELLSEHAWLRERFAKAEGQQLSNGDITEFAHRLSEHIRKEERHLFERLQQFLSPEKFASMGQELEDALREGEQICLLPAESERKRDA